VLQPLLPVHPDVRDDQVPAVAGDFLLRERPPLRVCAAFNVDPESLRPLADGSGWRGDGVVLRPATDSVEAVWAARALGSIVLPDVRIARPSRATDGRAIVGGWMAYRLAAGSGDEVAEERPSVEEIVLVSVKLHQALINVPRPDFID